MDDELDIVIVPNDPADAESARLATIWANWYARELRAQWMEEASKVLVHLHEKGFLRDLDHPVTEE